MPSRKGGGRDAKKLVTAGVTGVVKRYISTCGYGFITDVDDTYRDVPVVFHISAVSRESRRRDEIRIEDKVLYDLYLGPKGYRAESVRILNQEGSESDSDDTFNLDHDGRDSENDFGDSEGWGWGRRRDTKEGSSRHESSRQRKWGDFDCESSDENFSVPNRGRPSASPTRWPRESSDDKVFSVPNRGRPSASPTRWPRESSDDNFSVPNRGRPSASPTRWPRDPPPPPRRKADSSPGMKHQERKTNVKDNTHKSGYFCEDCNDHHPNTNHANSDGFKREETGKPSVYTKAKTDSKPFKNSGTFNDGTQFASQHFSQPSKKSDPQPTKPTCKPFQFGFGIPFPRNSEPSEGANRTTQTSTNTKKSDTEKKVPNPQPSTYLPKKGILKNPSNRGSFIYMGIPPRSPRLSSQKPQEQNADRKSDINANKSDLDRQSTLYSFSYVGKTKSFDIPMKHADPFSAGTRGPNHQKPNRSTPENAKPARNSEQNMKGSGTNADDAKTTGRSATEEQPTQTKPQMKGTTASKENLTDSNKTPEKETKKKASTTVSSLSRGNLIFRSALDQRSDLLKYGSLKSALGCYKKACKRSYQDKGFVSAAKKAATTCWILAKLLMTSRSASDQKETGKYFKDALQYFSKAYHKRSCRGQDWAKRLEKSIQSCLDDIKTWIAPKDDDDQIATLKEYLGYLPTCGAKINGYLHIAYIHMKRGKEALQFDEYENCQGYLKDCCVPLGEAENMLHDDVEPTIRLSVNALKKKVDYHESLVRKALARVKEAQVRQQREKADEKADEEAKKMAMGQLKSDIRMLDLFSKLSIEEFVKQVYLMWPPKGTKSPDVSSTSSSSSSKKELLIRAIRQYHPDKVDKEIHDIKWQLLSCEITKCLNMKLAIIK